MENNSIIYNENFPEKLFLVVGRLNDNGYALLDGNPYGIEATQEAIEDFIYIGNL